MRLNVHYVIKPEHLWASISHMAKTQHDVLLNTSQAGFKYIEEESFAQSFQGLFSEINLASDKLGKIYADRNAKPARSSAKWRGAWRCSRPTPTRRAMRTST